MPTADGNFVHRHNFDGTNDSICTRCNQTIGSTIGDMSLNAFEMAHQCDGWRHPVQSSRLRLIGTTSRKIWFPRGR